MLIVSVQIYCLSSICLTRFHLGDLIRVDQGTERQIKNLSHCIHPLDVATDMTPLYSVHTDARCVLRFSVLAPVSTKLARLCNIFYVSILGVRSMLTNSRINDILEKSVLWKIKMAKCSNVQLMPL